MAPLLFLAGCGKPNSPRRDAQVAAASSPVIQGDPEPVAQPDLGRPPATIPEHQEVVIPRGTALRVRIDEAVNTRRNRAGDQFRASLAEPIVVGGKTVVPRGTRFLGHVTESQPSGRLQGRAVLALTLDSFELDGKGYRVRTGSVNRVSVAHKKRNFELIGGGAGLGALIGGLAGGGKGAGIGAAAGGGLGGGVQAATKGQQIKLPSETVLTFTLQGPLTVIPSKGPNEGRPKLDQGQGSNQ
jgi:hypothetical protein